MASTLHLEQAIGDESMFIPGQIYRRRDLHRDYGGQQQGGICTPSRFPIVLLFTGESGTQHGYRDGWQNDGLFLYTGEGQRGEPHHIRRLSDGGPDHPRWVVAVCANCHRRAHYSRDAIEFNRELSDKVGQMETER